MILRGIKIATIFINVYLELMKDRISMKNVGENKASN